MLVLELLFLYLPLADSFQTITSGIQNQNLIATMQQVLCSTDSYSVHLLANDEENFHQMGVLIEWLNRDCSYKTVQLRTTDRLRISMKYHSVKVFMVDSIQRINIFLQDVTRNEESRNTYFLVVIKLEYDPIVIRNIFERFNENSFFNVLIMLHDESAVNIFKFNPFTGTIFSMNDTITLQSKKKYDIFVSNRNDLRGKSRNLIVSMYEQNDRALPKKNGRPGYTGMDGLIADLLEERMNVTFTYITPQEMYNGLKNSGVIGDLTRGRADMSFNADSLAIFLVNGIEVTEPFERNDICILVPKAGDEPIIYNLLRTLSKACWLITLLSLVVMALIYRWTQDIQKFIHSSRNPFYEYSWTEISTITFQSFFGDSITRIPTSMPLRMLIIGWCIYSFLITNAFQAKLITSLVIPRRLDDIETIEELGNSKLKIMYPTALANHIKEYSDNHTMSILRDQMIEVDSWSKFNAAICNKSLTDTAFITMRFYADLAEKKYFDKTTGRPLYKIMNECLLSFPRVYFMKFGSMYVDYVSELLRRFHEMGFIVKWTRYSEFTNGLQNGNIPIDDTEEDDIDEANIKVVITTDHLQTSFYLLLIGLAAAMLAFFAEHVYSRWETKSNRIEYLD